MKYIEIIAAENKPIAPFALEDVMTNKSYTQKAWEIWQNTNTYKYINTAKSYYKNTNTFITDFKRKAIFSVKNGNKIGGQINSNIASFDDMYETQVRMKNPLFADMIDQIASFILKNKAKIQTKDADIEELYNNLEDNHSFNHMIKLQIKEHLIKGYSGTNFRLDDDQNVCIEPLPAENFSFWFESSTKQTPEFVIADLTIENQFLETNAETKKETWKKMKLKKFLIISKNNIVEQTLNPIDNTWVYIDKSFKLTETGLSPVYDENNVIQLQEEILNEKNAELAYIPFSILTTQTLESELKKIKEFIDALDITTSDGISELINFIKTIWMFKGMDGMDISEIIEQLKTGIINGSDSAEATNLTGATSTEERVKLTDQLKESFYRFAKVVDMEKLKTLSNTSSVSIKALYEPLNQKAGDIETEVERYMIDILKKVYMITNIKSNLSKEEIEKKFQGTKIVFNHSMISNENEDLTANALQMGKVEEDVRLANHPWYANKTQKEIKKAAEDLESSSPAMPQTIS